MKKLKAAALSLCLLPLLSFSSVEAADSCCQTKTCEQDWCGGWKLGADFLFWKPCLSDSHYAGVGESAIGTATNTLKYHHLDAEWEPGVRVYLGKENIWECMNAMFVYTYIKADDTDSVTGPAADTVALSNPVVYDSTYYDAASTTWELEYNQIDGVFSYEMSDECNSFKFWAYSGFRAMWFDEDRLDAATESTDTLDVRSQVEYWGIGTLLGVKMSYTFCDCFEFFSTADFAFILGEAKRSTHSVAVNAGDHDQTFSDKDKCYAMPGWHLTKGLAYNSCWCDMEFSLRVGYELTQWVNAPHILMFEQDDAAALSANNKRTIAFHGMFIGGNIRY